MRAGERAVVRCVTMYVCTRPRRVGGGVRIYLKIDWKSALQ